MSSTYNTRKTATLPLALTYTQDSSRLLEKPTLWLFHGSTDSRCFFKSIDWLNKLTHSIMILYYAINTSSSSFSLRKKILISICHTSFTTTSFPPNDVRNLICLLHFHCCSLLEQSQCKLTFRFHIFFFLFALYSTVLPFPRTYLYNSIDVKYYYNLNNIILCNSIFEFQAYTKSVI